jgi:NADH dehydrogenase
MTTAIFSRRPSSSGQVWLARRSGRPIISVAPRLGHFTGWVLGKVLGDVVITRDEIEGLMQGLLATESPPVGEVKLSAWAREHRASLGRRYASELGRRRDREVPYANAR